MSILEDRAFHVVLVSKGNLDSKKVLDKLSSYSALGFRKFIIHVLTNDERPLYLEKLRNIVFENIAYTLIIEYHKLSRGGLNELLNRLENNPYEVIEA